MEFFKSATTLKLVTNLAEMTDTPRRTRCRDARPSPGGWGGGGEDVGSNHGTPSTYSIDYYRWKHERGIIVRYGGGGVDDCSREKSLLEMTEAPEGSDVCDVSCVAHFFGVGINSRCVSTRPAAQLRVSARFLVSSLSEESVRETGRTLG